MKAKERDALLGVLKARFEKNVRRHQAAAWSDVHARLEGNLPALRSLQAMEATGGEPDVVGYDRDAGQYRWCDCSVESPAGRRSVCYDREARDARKEAKPASSAVQMARRWALTC